MFAAAAPDPANPHSDLALARIKHSAQEATVSYCRMTARAIVTRDRPAEAARVRPEGSSERTHLQIRTTPRLPGPARSWAQTVRFGVASASHLVDQVTGRQGGFRAEGQARYVTVRDRSRLPFTALSRLGGSGRSRHEPASCQWICQWETWEIRDTGAGYGSEGWGFESLRARHHLRRSRSHAPDGARLSALVQGPGISQFLTALRDLVNPGERGLVLLQVLAAGVRVV